MKATKLIRGLSPVAVAIIAVALATAGAKAQDAVEQWSSITIPSAPKVQPIKIAGARTALLLLDFSVKVCSVERRPRCYNSLPKVTALLERARSHGLLIVYSTAADNTVGDIPKSLVPRPGDPHVHAGADKFIGTDLERILREKGIRSVVVAGTSAQGAVLYTASAAALRNYNVVVPVDGMSSDDPFAELATAWILANASASVSSHVKLTRTNLVTFE